MSNKGDTAVITSQRSLANPAYFVDRISAFSADSSNRACAGVMSFEDVASEALLCAGIIAQAVQDSMPDVIFTPTSKEDLFRSAAPEAYDAFDFLTTGRLELYADLANLSIETIRHDWRKQYQAWKKTKGEQVALNIINHIIRMMVISKENSAAFIDAKAFTKGPQFAYWARIAKRHPDELRSYIVHSVFETIRQAKVA